MQRSCSGTCSGDASCADCRKKPLQRHATGSAPASVPPIVHEVLQSPGTPLDRAVRDRFEPQFGIVFDGVSRVNPTSGGLTVGPAGTPFENEASRIASRVTTPAPALEPRFRYDFSKVRIHTDDRATQAARSVGAKAFTVGHDVVFGAGHYAPESRTGRELLAHELTHVLQQSGDTAMLQRAETDTVPTCAILADSQSDIDTHVNASLATARTAAGTPPAGQTVARLVRTDLGRDVQLGRTAIEVWASTLGPTKASLPAQNTTRYAGVTFRFWSNRMFPILNPAMKVNSICIGSDKLGHFFQQGWTFRQTESAAGTPAAEEESERTEGGGYGLATTGVFSNADQEANRQGGQFYSDVMASPTTSFAIASYISSQWSEVNNPNFYESGVGHQVWANVLTGNWTGQFIAGIPLAPVPLSVTLNATTAGAVTGTFSIGGPLVGSITGGLITYNTTTVRGEDPILRINMNRTPIANIHIDFDWTLGAESGKGFFDSSGERHLTGRWGRGTSNQDRGTWDIERA